MKVKHTQNGNVKITLTLEQVAHLKSLLNVSHFIISNRVTTAYVDESERSNAGLYYELSNAGIERHHG